MFLKLQQLITKWCLNLREISIKDFHEQNSPIECKIYNDDSNELKFVEQTITKSFVKTPTGLSPVLHSHKTVNYEVFAITTDRRVLYAADTHIVILTNRECYVKDLVHGDLIKTETGYEKVLYVRKTERIEQMYDLELNDENHVYYTNGILSHNSATSAAYLFWLACFHDDKTILIASNKNSNAMEMIHRIRFMYERLPMWLKPGLTEDGWNRHQLSFDNGSRILSQATTPDTGRGLALSLIFLDELAFVPPRIQEDIWKSISPTFATGGSCIITSTPNGDKDLFASIWRGANKRDGYNDGGEKQTRPGVNGFFPVHADWTATPGRDNEFKKREIAKTSELTFAQEYECQFLSSDPLLIDSFVLKRLTEDLTNIKPINVTDENVAIFTKVVEGSTYLIGVDPATGTGSDFTTIQVFEFPSMIQSMEFRSNTQSSSVVYRLLKKIIYALQDKGCTVYFSVENNGVGEGILALYEADERQPSEAIFVTEDGSKRLGFNTNGRSKLKACVALKEMIENNSLRINSNLLLDELKDYIRTGGSYAAKTGSTDDLISATLIVIRILSEIATYEQAAYDKLFAGLYYGEDEVEDGDDSSEPMLILF